MIKNELTVVQGFGCLNKVFKVADAQAITYGMLITVDAEGKAVLGAVDTLVTKLFVAQNTVANTDSAAMENSFNIDTLVTCYPLTAPIEIELPSVLCDAEILAFTVADIGKPISAGAAGTYADTGAIVVGTVSGISEDGLVTMFVGT